MYVSWGNYEGPHTHDIALENPARHPQGAAETACAGSRNLRPSARMAALPADQIARRQDPSAAVIDVTKNYVEHPEVVAERLERSPASSGANGWSRRPIPVLLRSRVIDGRSQGCIQELDNLVKGSRSPPGASGAGSEAAPPPPH